MYTVTFYSYRGGVGRTTALVNTGVDLALQGRKVLLVDFDLEAPSLPGFAPPPPGNGPHLGLVEFIGEYLRSGKAPDIADYVYRTKPVGEDGAEVWVMPAGRGDDDYWQAFYKIDWKELYDFQDGFILFEDIKFQWRESFHPDYVLVDARAGINDRLAICTRQLPDAVVMLFTPAQATSGADAGAGERAGFHRVLTDIVAGSLDSGPRRINLLPVASKVPDLDGESLRLHGMLESDYLDMIFDLAATIPYVPDLLVNRQINANVCPRRRLPQAYRRLANALIRSNCARDPEGALAFLRELQLNPSWAVRVPHAELADRWLDCTAQLDQVLDNFSRDPEIMAHAARCLYLAGRHQPALAILDEIPSPPDHILWQRACYRRRLRDRRAVDDLLELLNRNPRVSGRDLLSGRELLEELLNPRTPRQPMHAARIMHNRRMAREVRWWESGSLPPELGITLSDTADPLTYCFPGISPYVASAFLQLRQLAPDKVEEALRMPGIQELTPEARQALIDNAPPPPPPPLPAEQDPVWLIRARRWQAAIALLEPRTIQSASTDPFDYFYLGMAYWGAGNEARATALCQSGRELMLDRIEPESIRRVAADCLHLLFILSLMLWRAGDLPLARRFLDRCDELLAEAEDSDAFFSVWRFDNVTRDQLQEDCGLYRQMIHGAAIRPFFLGKEPGSS
jgi:hypothetical protein